jgi:drug/metabolite transporter (DMT)-like permease
MHLNSPRPRGIIGVPAVIDVVRIAALARPPEVPMYARFGAMIATSTVVMYGLMYLNTYQLDHVTFSETRTYMALLMGAVMAVIMLSFMLPMLERRRVNVGIYAGSIAVFALTLWLVRSQATVDDTSYMRAMIPHHSIAILTSERANITDPRVRELADEIIEAQREEIAEMKRLIEDLAARP